MVLHSIYLIWRFHLLALSIKHLINEFPWFAKIDGLLLGLSKAVHYSAQNHSILKEIQKAYGEKSVTMRHLLQGGYPMNQLLKRALKDTIQSLKHLITFWKVKLSQS